MTNPRISFLNGQFIEHSKAFVHIEDRGFQLADAVYEVILFNQEKFVDGVPHIERLFRSLREVNIKHNLSIDDLLKNGAELFAKNNMKEGALYLQISRGAANRTPVIPQGLAPTIVMTVTIAKKMTPEEFNKGLRVMTHDDIRWHRCDIKTVALLASSLINQKAKDAGYDDALFLRDGVISEGTFSNFFIINKDGILVTKNADNNILRGITRDRIIDLAKKNSIPVEERGFTIDELMQAKEAFLSSSTMMVRPVTQVNGINIGEGQAGVVTHKLNELYREFIQVF